MMIFVAVLFLLNIEWWWIPAAAAVMLSQALIYSGWHDAKFGTIANVMVLFATIEGFGTLNFHWSFVKDYREGLARTTTIASTLLTQQDIRHLPAPVQRYISYSGVLNREKIHNIKLCFTGQMREKGKDWFPFYSTLYNFFDIPTRLFYMTAKMKGMKIPGYHAYKNGNASMQIRLFGLLPVVNLKEGELKQAETVTMLNDMCLKAPASLIDKRIEWKEIDSLSSKATFTCNGITISAYLYFNENGQLVNYISDDRFALSGNALERYRFSTPVHDYKNINGINICSHGEAVRHYPEGEFVYWKFDLVSADYNLKNN